MKGSNLLPRMDSLKQRIRVFDKGCYLCDATTETCAHLVCYSLQQRVIQFGRSLAIRPNRLTIFNHEGIVRFVLDPPIQVMGHNQLTKKDYEQCTLLMAITLEAIQNLRNFVAHQKENVNIPIIIDNINKRVRKVMPTLDLAHNQDQVS